MTGLVGLDLTGSSYKIDNAICKQFIKANFTFSFSQIV